MYSNNNININDNKNGFNNNSNNNNNIYINNDDSNNSINLKQSVKLNQENINNEYNGQSMKNKIYSDSTFEIRKDDEKEEDESDTSSINSENCMPNKILSPELISQITQIIEENEYLKTRIKFHEDNVSDYKIELFFFKKL